MNEKTHKETSGIDKVFNNFIKDFLSEMSHHDIMDNDQVILVPTQQTAAYLRLKIAEQGIYAGTRIITAQDLISEIRCNSIKENNLDSLLYGDPWSKENLTWRILQVFNNYADEFPDNFKYWIGADKTSQKSTDEENSLDIDQDTLKLIVSDVAADLFDWIFDKVPQGKRFIRISIPGENFRFKDIERNLNDLEASFTEIITSSVCNSLPETITALNISSALKQKKNSLSNCIQQYQITGPKLNKREPSAIENYKEKIKDWEEKVAKGSKAKKPDAPKALPWATEFENKSRELSQQFQAELTEAFNTALNKIDTPEAIDFLNKAISSARARFATEGLSTSTIDYRKRKARRLTLAQTTAENYLRYLDQMPELLLELPNNHISQWQITLWKKLIQLNPEYGNPAQFITSFGVIKNVNNSIKLLPKSIFVYGFLFYSQSELNLISGLKNSNIKVKEYQLSDSGNLGSKLENWMPLGKPSENKIKKNKSYSLPQTTLHKCIGINRQVQAIQDLVVKLVNSQEENINPEEILILTPELDTLFPLLSFAFKHDNQQKYNSENDHPSKHIKLWFSHEARNDQSSETNQYLLTLFSLLDGPVNFQDIAKLFSLQGVLNAAGLSYDDGQDLIVLMQDAQAAWGWDYNSQLRSEILPNRTGTIEYVLRCIASSISVDTKEAICWDSNDSDTSVYTPKINSSITVSVAAKAIQYLEQLRNLICSINPKESYKAIDLTIDNWSAFLQESLDDAFFKPAIVDEKIARAIARKWLDKTGQILSLNPEENQITLTLDEVKKLAESRISKQRIPGNMLPGTPVVCATNELHCTPYKHVILTGFTDKNFPFANKVYGDDALLNIESEKICKLRNETRESFKQLYALLTSAKQVDIVYSSRSEYTGKVLDTPTVIADIEQELSPVRSITYGLQPFSKPDADLIDVHSYKDHSKMRGAYINYRNKSTDRYSKKLSQWPFSKNQFDSQKEIDLSDLLSFYKDPTDYFVKKKLGIFIPDDETKSYGLFDETEPSYLFTAQTKASALTELEAPNGFRYEPDNYEKNLYSPVISDVFKQLDSSIRNYAGVEALSQTFKKPDPAIEEQVMTVFAKLQYLFMDDATEETSKRRFADNCSFVPNLPMQVNVDEYKISGTIKNCLVSESCVVEIESNTLKDRNNNLNKDRDTLAITIKAAVLLLSQNKNIIEFGKLWYSKNQSISDILNTVTVQNNQILSDWLTRLIKIYLIGQQLPLPLDINTIKPYKKSETDTACSNTTVDKKTLYKFDKDNRNYHEEYDRVLWGENANWQELINIPIDQLENYKSALKLIVGSEQESNGSIFKLLANQIDWSNVIDSPSDSKKGK